MRTILAARAHETITKLLLFGALDLSSVKEKVATSSILNPIFLEQPYRISGVVRIDLMPLWSD
jgi:hypothetical protein